MSAIYGIRKCRQGIVLPQEMQHIGAVTEDLTQEGSHFLIAPRVGMGFQPHFSHGRSKLEIQPITDSLGNMLTMDGRIDNHAELRSLLGFDKNEVSDSSLTLAAFLRWGPGCFSRLVGDWAVAIWSAQEQALYLARDHAGTRSLYFSEVKGVAWWSTHLETFFATENSYPINEEYVARYLALRPVLDLTPYKRIYAVPPAHFLVLNDNGLTKRSHWEWMVTENIRFPSDIDYEERFSALLKQSVARRDVPGAPSIAHLSGGVDSTSIVCMSDHIRRSNELGTPLIDTLSFYDDSEPSWNEQPYFSAVELSRGKTGLHIRTSFRERTFEPVDQSEGMYRIPGADSSAITWEKMLRETLENRGYQAILSGVGGDEVLGGIPSPYPELADCLVSRNFARLVQRTIDWCLVDRRPFLPMLFGTAWFTLRLYQPCLPRNGSTIPHWLTPRWRGGPFACPSSLDTPNSNRWAAQPSAIDNGLTWWTVMETLPHLRPAALTKYEYRYPYLDRDLVDFMFRIPRDQVVGPGRRRSLMRRALKGLVPAEILERRRKAFVSRGPLASLQGARDKIESLFAHPLSAEYGFIDPGRFRAAFGLTVTGKDTRWIGYLMRSIAFELWLRSTFASTIPS